MGQASGLLRSPASGRAPRSFTAGIIPLPRSMPTVDLSASTPANSQLLALPTLPALLSKAATVPDGSSARSPAGSAGHHPGFELSSGGSPIGSAQHSPCCPSNHSITEVSEQSDRTPTPSVGYTNELEDVYNAVTQLSRSTSYVSAGADAPAATPATHRRSLLSNRAAPSRSAARGTAESVPSPTVAMPASVRRFAREVPGTAASSLSRISTPQDSLHTVLQLLADLGASAKRQFAVLQPGQPAVPVCCACCREQVCTVATASFAAMATDEAWRSSAAAQLATSPGLQSAMQILTSSPQLMRLCFMGAAALTPACGLLPSSVCPEQRLVMHGARTSPGNDGFAKSLCWAERQAVVAALCCQHCGHLVGCCVDLLVHHQRAVLLDATNLCSRQSLVWPRAAP